MATATEIIRGILLSAVPLFLQPVLAQIQTPPQCKSVVLRVSLKNGDSYQKSLGALTLKIDAQKDHRNKDLGWRYSLVDDLDRDYIYPANLPIRFNPLQTLGAGYDLSARESMDWSRSARFLLSKEDYERIDPLLKQALWPVDSPDPENAGNNFIDALRNTDNGVLDLNILDAEVASENIVKGAVFEIRFTVPAAFRFDPSLPAEVADCTQPMTIEHPLRDPTQIPENQ